MRPVNGTSDVVLSIVSAPVTSSDAFLGAANALLVGLRPLTEAPGGAWPLTFLAGQVVECALKAFLAKKGVSDKELKSSRFGHNLTTLLSHARDMGLDFRSQDDLVWFRRLAELHGGPYMTRYPMGVHGLVLPQVMAMTDDIHALVDAVRNGIRAAEMPRESA